MKKSCLILLFSLFVSSVVLASPLSYEAFVKKYKEASDFYSKHEYDHALQVLDTIVDDDFSQIYPSVFLSRSLTLFYLGRYEEAKIDIDKCISLQPYALKPLLCRSMISTAMKDYDAALTDINYCLEKNSYWADAYHQKGLICLNLTRYSDALQNFNMAISNANGVIKPEYYSDRGFAYYYLGDFENAKKEFIYSLKMIENENVYLCLIDLCYKLQQYDEGIKYADKLIKKGNLIEAAIIERAYIYLAQGRYEEVCKDLKSLENSCTSLSSYHKVKGIYFILTENKDMAKEEIEIAFSLNPKDKDILFLKNSLGKKDMDKQKLLEEMKSNE